MEHPSGLAALGASLGREGRGGAPAAPALRQPRRAPKAQAQLRSNFRNSGNEAAVLLFQFGVCSDVLKILPSSKMLFIRTQVDSYSQLSSVWVEGTDGSNASAHMDRHPKVTLVQSPASNLKSLSEALVDRNSCALFSQLSGLPR